jgi:PKD repeat protein
MKRLNSILALLILNNLNLYAQIEEAKTMEYPWQNNSKIVHEVKEKRDETTKHFLQSDGSFAAYTTTQPIHYKKNGVFENIVLDITSYSNNNLPKHNYANTSNSFSTYYPADFKKDKIITSFNNLVFEEKLSSIYFTDSKNNTIENININYTKPVVSNNNLLIPNISNNLDLQYTQTYTGRKFDLIIKNKSFLQSIPQQADFIVIEESVTLSSKFSAHKDLNGIHIIVNGDEIATIPTPFAIESESSSKNYLVDNDLLTNGDLEYSLQGNTLTVKTKFPISWITDNSREFPIYLDPTINVFPMLNSNFWTGYSTGTTKINGLIRVAAVNNIGWAKFNVSSIQNISGIFVNNATYHGYHYSTTGTPDKLTDSVNLTNFDPVTTIDNVLITQINNGPTYLSNYNYGGSVYQWRLGVLPTAANADLSTRIAQGFIALGFRYTSGSTTFMYHYGNNSTINMCFLEIDYRQGYDNDAALEALVSPGNPICPGSSSTVSVILRNEGLADLDSCLITWQCRRPSEPLPFPAVTYNFKGNILPKASSSPINIGFLQGGFQIGDTLRIYTSLPNGIPDSLPGDDSLTYIFFGGISGTYTIGDTLNGQNDFYDFTHAADFVNAAGGVCDSLIFLVSDSVFNEQITFTKILGTSPTRPVLFKPKSTNTNPVVLSHTATAGGNNYTIRFMESANYIYFVGIHINNLGATFGTVVKFEGNNEGCAFINCHISTPPTTNINSNKALIHAPASSINSRCLFKNNILEGGSLGVLFSGESFRNLERGNTFSHNTFLNQYNKPAFFALQTELNFTHNHIESNSSYNPAEAAFLNSAAIHLRNLSGENTVSENTILPFFYFPIYGIVADSCIGNPNAKLLVANNWVSTGQSFSLKAHAGLYSVNSMHMVIAHNNFYNEGFATDNASVKVEGGSSVEIYNNNLYHTGIGPCLDLSTTFCVQNSNHNNLVSNGAVASFVNQTITTLAQWTAISGYDNNSVSVNPQYHNAPQDLHVCNLQLKNAGTPISRVTHDKDGDIRNVNSPDIGADEFTPVSTFSLGNDIGLCVGDSVQLKISLTTGDIAIWSTGDTAASIWVYGPAVRSAMLLNQCGFKRDTITIDQIALVTLPSDTNLCADDSYTINLSGYSNYQWSNGNTTNSVTLNQAGTVNVTVTDKYGCKSNDAITITKSGKVRINTDIPNNILCNNFFGNIEAILPNASYQWNTGSTNKIITVNNGGTYFVIGNDKGCISTDSITIIKDIRPTANFTFGTSYLTVDLTNTSTPPGLNNFMWRFGDGNTSTLRNPKNIYSTSGFYDVTLYVTNVCGTDSITQQVYVEILSVENLKSEFEFTLFPNPAKENLNINYSNLPNDVYNINVYDSNGKLVLTEYQTLTNNGNLTIQINAFTNGIYFLNLNSKTETIFKAKFIKH